MKQANTSTTLREIVSDAQRLRFAVQFAQMDLDTLRPGDWLNLQWNLRDFLNPIHNDFAPGGLYVSPDDPPAPEAYSREDFRALQVETLNILEMVLDGRKEGVVWKCPSVQIRFAVAPLLDPPAGKEGRHFLMAEGTTRDMFLLRLWTLLGASDTAGLLRCPECGTIFFRRKNQEYCSRACVNRVTQRRWRERHESVAT